MYRVWAYRDEVKTQFKNNPKRHYDLLIEFSNFDNLISQIKENKTESLIRSIDICAHGDVNGLVQLGSPHLNHTNVNLFSRQFNDLKQLMAPNSFLTFQSCIAGRGNEGSELLCKISLQMPWTIIVGFTVYGVAAGGYAPDIAGNLPATFNSLTPSSKYWIREDFKGKATKEPIILDAEANYAKWAKNGSIIRLPVDEVRIDSKLKPGFGINGMLDLTKKKFFCAKLNCPGHKSNYDRCIDYKNYPYSY